MLKHIFIGYITILILLPYIALADIKTKYACPWNVDQQEQGFIIQYTGTKNVKNLNFYAFFQDTEKSLTYENIQESVHFNMEIVSTSEKFFKLPQKDLDVYLIASDTELEGLKSNKLSISKTDYQKTNVLLEPITNTKDPGDGTLILRPVKQDNAEFNKLSYMKVCRVIASTSGD
ncbi:hypothetical protein [Candidatus Venteria ishoeyi]|uniref:Uncharacterized protein n=1 Tax=Candidatus Venteria ishoeyi TaxID=1899563 RepID=A0A1H6F8N4_9GAMM|nr:hypothetical protein [Candidatus Venteria ishoeyi]SEH05446.1 Uncharacterised protein [Candidatus Venteria ishoeyi]